MPAWPEIDLTALAEHDLMIQVLNLCRRTTERPDQLTFNAGQLPAPAQIVLDLTHHFSEEPRGASRLLQASRIPPSLKPQACRSMCG